jgi:glycosyltransferase involved in cell wall biosynthesis
MSAGARVGVVPHLDPSGGGIYQYSLSVLSALATGNPERQYVVYTDVRDHPVFANLSSHRWLVRPELPPPLPHPLSPSGIRLLHLRRYKTRQAATALRSLFLAGRSDAPLDMPHIRRTFRRDDVEMVLFPAPVSWACATRVPYIMAVHDLQHRLQPQFPEVGNSSEWTARELMYRKCIPRATAILVDSEVGKEELLNFYGAIPGVEAGNVKILPFVPPPYLLVDAMSANESRVVLDELDLPNEYLFYPAQFWPHKNHLTLVRALGILHQRRTDCPPLVLVGSHADPLRDTTFRTVMAEVERLGIARKVHYAGYVGDHCMPGLYRGARALIMPTFFGPTNIPVLEAWTAGCPVVTSDIRGIREQVGDAALLADPRSPEDLAAAIDSVCVDSTLRDDLIRRGRTRLSLYTHEDFSARLQLILGGAVASIGVAA